MAGVSVKVKGTQVVASIGQSINAAMADLRKVNNVMGQRLRRNAINRLNDRQIRDRVTTNTLGRSIQIVNEETKGRVFTNLVYARIQQAGGVIRAKKKYLAIPATKQLKRSGKWPKDFPEGTFYFAQSKGGNPLLFWAAKLGKGKRRTGTFGSRAGEVAYILRRQVTIPARPYLLITDADAEYYANRIIAHLKRAASTKKQDNPE